MKALLLMSMLLIPVSALSCEPTACKETTIRDTPCQIRGYDHTCTVYTCGNRKLFVITNSADQVSMVFVQNPCTKERVLYFKKETQM